MTRDLIIQIISATFLIISIAKYFDYERSKVTG